MKGVIEKAGFSSRHKFIQLFLIKGHTIYRLETLSLFKIQTSFKQLKSINWFNVINI